METEAAKILFVDDEPAVLDGIRRTLRKSFDLSFAESGPQGLDSIRNEGPFAVVVSDMQMPEMNGAEFLSEVRRETPETVRIMLTGNADQQTAVTAINDSDVYRFLTKPCEREELESVLRDAVAHFQQRRVEKDLLERTVQGSVDLLAQLLSLSNPQVFGKSQRLADLAERLAKEAGFSCDWSLRTTALLSQIGCINADGELVERLTKGTALEPDVIEEYYEHLKEGADLMMRIPRFESVAQSIQCQLHNADGTGYPSESYLDVPQAAKVLRVCLTIDEAQCQGRSVSDTLLILDKQKAWYDEDVLSAAGRVLGEPRQSDGESVEISRLVDNMVLMEDVHTADGVLLVCRGWETNETVRKHLLRACENGSIPDRVNVTCLA